MLGQTVRVRRELLLHVAAKLCGGTLSRFCKGLSSPQFDERGNLQVPRGVGVIQGDGINVTSLSTILTAVLEAGYSAEVWPLVLTILPCCTICKHERKRNFTHLKTHMLLPAHAR